MPESSLQMRAGAYAEHDIWNQALIARGDYYEGNSVLGQNLVREEQFLQSVFYREFLKPLRIARLRAGIVFGNDSPGTLPTVCSTFRDASDPPSVRPRCTPVCAGEPLSARLGVSEETARTHLKHVFEKTGTHRQAELVKLLLALGSTRT